MVKYRIDTVGMDAFLRTADGLALDILRSKGEFRTAFDALATALEKSTLQDTLAIQSDRVDEDAKHCLRRCENAVGGSRELRDALVEADLDILSTAELHDIDQIRWKAY